MKMSYRGIGLALVVTLCLLVPFVVLAQEDQSSPPLKIQLTLDRAVLTADETTQATLTLRNISAFTLTNVTVQLQGTAFSSNAFPSVPDPIAPYSGARLDYGLQSQMVGSHNASFVVQYTWDDSNSPTTRQWIETVSVNGVEVRPWPDFDWPDYLIPLVLGLLVGLSSGWFNDWRKQQQEEQQREEQARGVTLAILQAARKGVEAQEQVSFNLWEEAVVKGHLYPALHRLGRRIGKPELSKQLAELSIGLAEYNRRYENNNLTAEFMDELNSELDNLVQIIESRF